jgi:hypothetical protein
MRMGSWAPNYRFSDLTPQWLVFTTLVGVNWVISETPATVLEEPRGEHLKMEDQRKVSRARYETEHERVSSSRQRCIVQISISIENRTEKEQN